MNTETTVETYGRFTRGAKVKVRNMRGDFHICYFRQEQNQMTATLYGGPSGYSSFRTVAVDRLIKRRNQEKRET